MAMVLALALAISTQSLTVPSQSQDVPMHYTKVYVPNIEHSQLLNIIILKFNGPVLLNQLGNSIGPAFLGGYCKICAQ